MPLNPSNLYIDRNLGWMTLFSTLSNTGFSQSSISSCLCMWLRIGSIKKGWKARQLSVPSHQVIWIKCHCCSCQILMDSAGWSPFVTHILGQNSKSMYLEVCKSITPMSLCSDFSLPKSPLSTKPQTWTYKSQNSKCQYASLQGLIQERITHLDDIHSYLLAIYSHLKWFQ